MIEAECATHAVVCDVDRVRCKRAVNAESMRNALHVLRLVLVLLLLMIFAGGAVGAVLIELFTNVAVPSKGISSNGTNISSQLTQELLLRLKCSPVFRTRRAVQQDVQRRAVSLGAAAWSSVESSHSVSARRQRRPERAGRGLHDRPACSLEGGGRLG